MYPMCYGCFGGTLPVYLTCGGGGPQVTGIHSSCQLLVLGWTGACVSGFCPSLPFLKNIFPDCGHRKRGSWPGSYAQELKPLCRMGPVGFVYFFSWPVSPTSTCPGPSFQVLIKQPSCRYSSLSMNLR